MSTKASRRRLVLNPLRRAIMRLLEDNLAEKMLTGDISEGWSTIMDVNTEGEIIVMTGDDKNYPPVPTPAPPVWDNLPIVFESAVKRCERK